MAEHRAFERQRQILRGVFAGRKLILVGGPLAMLTGLGRALCGLGAAPPFLLGSEPGTGEQPDPAWCTALSLGIRGSGVMEAFARYEAALGAPPPAARAALDAYDPARAALALGLILLSPVPEVAGRRRYGARRAAWLALEDKTTVDALWDDLGVPRAPSAVVAAQRADLVAAARRLDRGAGTVWVADASEGPHGGATRQRWVQDDDGAAAAAAFLARHARRARVMPFLEGIPCSIHGIVFADGTVVLRPVELLVLRRADRAELFYAGTATHWQPPRGDREALRALARRVGEALRGRCGYRGAFTIDGVMTADGFRPTELNPRIGHGLLVQGAAVPELPLGLLALAAIEEERAFDAAALEPALLAAVDARPQAAAHAILRQGPAATQTTALAATADGGYRAARDGEPVAAVLSIGPSAMGGFAAFAPRPEALAAGAPVAPRVAAALAWADRALGTGVGPLRPAVDVAAEPGRGGLR